MTVLAILGVCFLLAGAAYFLTAHGASIGLALESEGNASADTERHRDAQRGAKIFGDIGNVLQSHKQAVTGLLSAGRDAASSGGPDARLAKYVGEMNANNRIACEALEAQRRLLEELSGSYGGLYDNEERHLESYCKLTEKLDEALEALDRSPGGDSDRLTLMLARRIVRENDKLRTRVSGCESQIQSLMGDLTRLRRESLTDSLTQLPNRRAWEEVLAQPEAAETGRVFVMLDLDKFKEINDSYGHYAGDGVLNLVATMIRNTAEVNGYRIAGDEFAMLMPASVWSRAGRILEQLRSRVEKASLHDDGQRIQVTVSVGAALSLPNESPSETLRRADEALYASKGMGGNAVHLAEGREDGPRLTGPTDAGRADLSGAR